MNNRIAKELTDSLSDDALERLYSSVANEPVEAEKKRQELFKRLSELPNKEIEIICDMSGESGHDA